MYSTFLKPLEAYTELNTLREAYAKSLRPTRITGCTDAQKSHLIATLAADSRIRLVVTHNDLRAKELVEDLKLYEPNVLYYPAKDVIFYSADIRGNVLVTERLRVIRSLLEGERVTIVTTIDGGMDRVPPIGMIADRVLEISSTDSIDIKDFTRRLVDLGYYRVDQVEKPGEFSVRGGIIDIFGLTEELPCRIELWGDEIDSIRSFEPDSQRSREKLDGVRIYPAAEIIPTEDQRLNGIHNLRVRADEYIKDLRKDLKPAEATNLSRAVEEFCENVEYLGGAANLDSYISFFCKDAVSFFENVMACADDKNVKLSGSAGDGSEASGRGTEDSNADGSEASGKGAATGSVSNLFIFLDEPARIVEKGEAVSYEFTESMRGRLEHGYILPEQTESFISHEAVIAKLAGRSPFMLSALDYKFAPIQAGLSMDMSVRSINSYNGNFEMLVHELEVWKRQGYRVVLLSGSRSRAERLAKDLCERGLNAFYSKPQSPASQATAPSATAPSATETPATEQQTPASPFEREILPGEILVAHGSISRGFEYPFIKFAVISESDIFGAEKKKKKKKTYSGKTIADFAELGYGDYVVHETYGIGIYRGIEQIDVDHVKKDYVKVEYAGGGTLYVLASAMGALQKYAGADARPPKVNKLNSTEWKTTKTKVRHAVEEIATELVDLYAKRQMRAGHQFCQDTVWQREFEELFPYEETDDQLRAIEDTKRDMESSKVMDRLICGDVGYGKTEIAIRAAFKAVQDSKQVAFLVPTTILAQQHYNTFIQRMKDYPVAVEVLSRFKTAAQQKKILEGCKNGSVDIVIGTHRLLSKDVGFKNLGLLIVDEEQRFGVKHKEQIKHMKGDVDVLTLTATPIPRTLHMSLVGIRDMSVLEEPPADRQPIQTFVLEYNEEIIREAINRELARGGQVYYVHNRVRGIDEIANRLQALVPDASISYAHGQMSERELEQIMFGFINGEIDVLVSTTIIETGMDISNVNTMIIDDVDRLGLAQLYQLRGRVGRTNRTAYAFLMYKRDKVLKEIAEKRLAAIREYTDLGSGIKIAMRDLEIRGAGNLLGAAQSGHMEAVGYDLYCKLLNDAVRRLKGEATVEDEYDTSIDLDMDAYIPEEYIKNEIRRLDMYKRIATIETSDERIDLLEELTDRYGDVPAPVDNLLGIALVKAKAHNRYCTAVAQKGKEVSFTLYERAPLGAEVVERLGARYPGRFRVQLGTNPVFIFKPEGPTAGRRGTKAQLLLAELEEFLDGWYE